MGVADVFFVHAMHSAGATWNPHPPVISPRPVAASTGDASRTPHECLTNASRTPHDSGTLGATWHSLRAERSTVVYVGRFDEGSRPRRARAVR